MKRQISWFHEDDEYSELSAESHNRNSGFGPEKYKIKPFTELRPDECVVKRELIQDALYFLDQIKHPSVIAACEKLKGALGE